MPESTSPIGQLLAIMAQLRDREAGCAWDLEQTFETIAPYTVEEAYEVADAIQRGSLEDLRDELGDLLFQVVFHSRMAEEAGAFAFDDVARAIIDKMIRRHPHIFGEAGQRTSGRSSSPSAPPAWDSSGRTLRRCSTSWRKSWANCGPRWRPVTGAP